MKALLYKDYLVAKKYLRMILLMDLVFVGVAFFSAETPFLSIFPMVMCSAAVTSLISYDERAHFDRQCDMMPLSRRTQVNEKYLLCLVFILTLGLLCAAGVLRNYPAASFERWGMLLLLPALGLLPSSLMLPLIFKLGSERGRIYYFIFYFAGLAAAMLGSNAAAEGSFQPGAGLFAGVLALSLLLYAVSWRLSIRFYEKREF